jgi:putative SOS response-associated peptidase YedK
MTSDQVRLARRKQIIEEHFDTTPWKEDWNPRFNIAPRQPVPIIRQHAKEIRQCPPSDVGG